MDLEANLSEIQTRMLRASERANRDPASVRLMAVSKGHPPEAVEALARLGLNLFGESKVQEGKAKVSRCSSRLHWHMLGHLQTNKCRDAVHFFEMIQSVDSMHLAEELQSVAEKQARQVKILLEVNVAGESSKFGYRPDDLLKELSQLNALARLEIHGLMTIAPWTPDPEKVRPYFRQLSDLKEKCEQQLGAPLAELSMGMSGDFEVAIEEGSTLVRIGTALFGARAPLRG